MRMAAKNAMERMPMPNPMIMNSLTSLSRVQLRSSPSSIGDPLTVNPAQLMIPLHWSFRVIHLLDFAHLNSWQLVVSLNSVQMALNPLAPTALSATKNL